MTRGYVLKIPHASGHEFRSIPIEELMQSARERYHKMLDAVPIMKAMVNRQDDELVVHAYSGIAEMKTALKYKIDSLKDQEYLAWYSLMREGNKDLLAMQKDINAELKKQNTSVRAIAPDHRSLEAFKKIDQQNSNSEVIWVDPDLYASEYSIEITPNFVRLVMPRELTVLILDSKRIAHSFRAMFELAWRSIRTQT